MKVLVYSMLFLVLNVQAETCKIVRKELNRVYLGMCPEKSYVIGARVNHIGNFTYTYVKCEEITLECEDKPEENEDSE